MGQSKRLQKIKRGLVRVEVSGLSRDGRVDRASDELAGALHELGDHQEIDKFKAANAYIAARKSGASHELACQRAAQHIGKSTSYANDLVQAYRQDQADGIADYFDHWRARCASLDEALLKVAREWGFGDGKADRRGRAEGRGIEDLRALLASEGRDVSASMLKAGRRRRS